MTSEGYQCQEMSVIADQIWTDIRHAETWLLNLKSCIPKMKIVPVNITNMVASLFLLSKTEVLSDLGIQTLVEIAKQHVSQVETGFCGFFGVKIALNAIQSLWY